MVAPLSQASNNSTGMSGYTSSCGSGANTSAYVGTQQLAMLPGCSSSGFGKIERSTGNIAFGSEVTYTLGADVDIHSEIYYNWCLPGLTTGSWVPNVGLYILKRATIKVGEAVWETIDRESMNIQGLLELPSIQHTALTESWSSNTTSTLPCCGSSKLMCCVKGGSRGQLFMAAMPYQTVTIAIEFADITGCFNTTPTPPNPANNVLTFDLYTKQHILSPYERELMQSTDILQLLSTTQHHSYPILSGILPGVRIPTIDLSFFNEYCTHICVYIEGGSFKEIEFVYNGTSAQGMIPYSLCRSATMMGLSANGYEKYAVFQLANTPCVTSLTVDQTHVAPFAGGDGVSNNRFDVIQFNATVGGPEDGGTAAGIPSGTIAHFVAFGAQSILYSQGGAVQNK